MTARLTPAAAAALLLLTASGASAQEYPVPNDPQSFHGVSAFQTSDLIDGPGVQILSGVAVSTRYDDWTYSILLFALDYYQAPEGGDRRVSAMQNCVGQIQGEDLVITCEVQSTSGSNYSPDNFRLHRFADRHWTGVITSSDNKPVDFVDLD